MNRNEQLKTMSNTKIDELIVTFSERLNEAEVFNSDVMFTMMKKYHDELVKERASRIGKK